MYNMLKYKSDIEYKKCDAEMHQSSSVAAIELIFGAITVLLTVSVIIIIIIITTTTTTNPTIITTTTTTCTRM